MNHSFIVGILLISSIFDEVLSCINILVSSKTLGKIQFTQLPANKYPSFNGRPIYYSKNHELFIFHIVEDDEFGRWIMSISLEDHDKAIAFADSWAVTPYLVHQVGVSPWTVYSSADEWVVEPTFDVYCERDETLYFDPGVHLSHQLAGFYVLRHHDENLYGNRPIYVLINDHHPVVSQIFLHYLDGFWVLGDEAGKDQSIAHIKSDAESPRDIPQSLHWQFLKIENDGNHYSEWIKGDVPSRMISSSPGMDIYSTLREYRMIYHIPLHQQQYELRNSVLMPVIGLGTGGIPQQQTRKVLKTAINAGYRLIDLAREYRNEHIVAEVFKDLRHSFDEEHGHHVSSHIQRSDVFIVSKVWPTELGFAPTEEAIMDSLEKLGTNYIDLFLIHWPECDHDVSWMHCQDTVDPKGTWEGSWHALEKAYAEGRVAAIGVSNFNITMLEKFAPIHSEVVKSEKNPHLINYDYLSHVKVLPHVVQNWAEPGNIDNEVLEWCKEKNAVYQTYATLRNLHQLHSEKRKELDNLLYKLSKKYRVSTQAVALRLMTQKGLAVIPRSTNEDHMMENLNINKWSLTSDELIEFQHLSV